MWNSEAYLRPKKLCALNESQKVESNLWSYMNVGIFFGSGELLDGLEAWSNCGGMSKEMGDNWLSAILGRREDNLNRASVWSKRRG